MDGYKKLLLLAVKVDGDRSAAVDVQISVCLLAVWPDPFSSLDKGLLDLHLWLLSACVHVGAK